MDEAFFSTEMLDGYFAGEDPARKQPRRFFADRAPAGNVWLVVHYYGKGSPTLELDQTAFLLVQLVEHPNVLWLAHAVAHEGKPSIHYIPLQPLASRDGTPVEIWPATAAGR